MTKAFRFYMAVAFSILLGLFMLKECYPSEETPPSATPDQDELIQACFYLGAHQAWGALARFNGAPQRMILTPRGEMEVIFGTAQETGITPPEGIYLIDEYKGEELADYTEQAYYGWATADRLWIPTGKENSGYSVLLAVFFNFCKDNLPK